MYSQKSEEYVGGHLVRTDEQGNLYRGIMSFMMNNNRFEILCCIRHKDNFGVKYSIQWLQNEIKKIHVRVLARTIPILDNFQLDHSHPGQITNQKLSCPEKYTP